MKIILSAIDQNLIDARKVYFTGEKDVAILRVIVQQNTVKKYLHFSSTKKTKKYFDKYETHRTFVYEDIRRWKRNKK